MKSKDGGTIHDRITSWLGEAEEKRRQLEQALKAGDVGEPVSISIGIIGLLKLAAVTAAVSIGAAPLTRTLTPRGKARQ